MIFEGLCDTEDCILRYIKTENNKEILRMTSDLSVLCRRYSAEEIEEKVNTFRLMLQEREEPAPPPTEKPAWVLLQTIETDILCTAKFFHPYLALFNSVTETHALAAANQQKNDRLREAFGISSDYVDGSSFHPDRKEREKEKREQERLEREKQQQKYLWVDGWEIKELLSFFTLSFKIKELDVLWRNTVTFRSQSYFIWVLTVLSVSHHFLSGLSSLMVPIHLLSEKRAVRRRKRKTKAEKGKLENGGGIWNTWHEFKESNILMNQFSLLSHSSASPSPSPRREKKKDKRKKKKRFHLIPLIWFTYITIIIHMLPSRQDEIG